MDARSLLILVSVSVLGCSVESEPVPTSPDESACSAPNRVVGERCLAPGVQDDGCPAGTLGLGDGSCQPAGVPPELCAEGFVHDGDAGCEPILPAEPCDTGQMAIPGERACHPVMACGSGTWGDIPIDSATVYVDGSYLNGDGSMLEPWTTIGEAVAAAPAGALIAIAAGSYVEDVIITKPVRLWGVCPERVELAGTIDGYAALSLEVGSNGSEVRGLAITGDQKGVGVSSASDIVLEQLWVHDALDRGMNVRSSRGPASVTLRSSLLEQNHELGVAIFGSEARLEGVVVRRTLPRASDQGAGVGISIQVDLDTGTPSIAHVQSSLVEENRQLGVWVGGSEANLEGVVVRRTLPRASDQGDGEGIGISSSPMRDALATARVTSSLVEANHESGVYVIGAEATLDGVIVRGTLPQASTNGHGWGITVASDVEWGASSTLHLQRSLVDRNYDLGVAVLGAEASLEGVVVRGTLPQASDQRHGCGIAIQRDVDSGERSMGSLKGSLIEENHELGVSVSDSEATLEGVLVNATLPRESDGLFGDGVTVYNYVPREALTSAVITGSRIENSARAGVVNFGVLVSLGGSALSCNAFDLDIEVQNGLSHNFEDLGGNGCGCPEPIGSCHAQSTGLTPPEPVMDPF